MVDAQWTWRAVAALLDIRNRQAQDCIFSEGDSGAASPADVVVPASFVMPDQWMTECNRELRAQYAPFLKENWELKHGRTFVLKSKKNPDGCDLRKAYPTASQQEAINSHSNFPAIPNPTHNHAWIQHKSITSPAQVRHCSSQHKPSASPAQVQHCSSTSPAQVQHNSSTCPA